MQVSLCRMWPPAYLLLGAEPTVAPSSTLNCPFNNDIALIIRQPCIYTVEVINIFKGNFAVCMFFYLFHRIICCICWLAWQIWNPIMLGLATGVLFCSPIDGWSTVSSYSSSELNLLKELASGCPTKGMWLYIKSDPRNPACFFCTFCYHHSSQLHNWDNLCMMTI